MLTLLTATGARPEAWAICQRLMAAQDYAGAVRWVIVDDGPEPQPVTFERDGWTLEVVRPEPYWQPGQNTQARNLAAGLEVIGPDEWVQTLEDDDYYPPGWLSAVAHWLDTHDLVGESYARYFNVATGLGYTHRNNQYASLCATAFKGAALAAFRRIVERKPTFIDLGLWREFGGSKKLRRANMTVGIKGLPGRGGIGVGHRRDFGGPASLREWIGEDAAAYGY